MPSPVNQLEAAYRMTFEGGHPTAAELRDPERRSEFVADYLENLQLAGSILEAPEEPQVADDLAFAILNREAPIEDRRAHASRAIDSAKATFFGHMPAAGVDFQKVHERSEVLSGELVEVVVDAAASYPDQPDVSAIKDKMGNLVSDEKNPENSAVAAAAMFNILQPYIVDRMLELNIYDPKELREQVSALQYDAALVLRFYRSVSGTARAAIAGGSEKSSAEMADELFDIGPIFVQLGQTFSKTATKPGTDEETKEFLHSIGKAMQEGVAKADDAQIERLTNNLPDGLSMGEALSSAKMAYVFNTSTSDQAYVTKIKRPGIEQAASDNVRMFMLMTDIVVRYIETHAPETQVAKNLSVVKNSLPFGLALLEADITEELDFAREAQLQKRAGEILARHHGIIVPNAVEQYSDDNHITMGDVPGQRVSEVPAHPDYVKNALVLLLRGRRRNALFHGDMHGGNIKAATNEKPGTLVAYDWGGSFEMPRGFEAKLLPLAFGVVRKNPKTMAKAYRRIQSDKFHQVTQGEAETAAKAAIEAASERQYVMPEGKEKLSRLDKLKQDTASIFSNYIGLLGKDYQSTLDPRYLRYIRSSKALVTIIKQELAKPDYSSKTKRNITLAKNTAKAAREVYLKRTPKNN